MNQNSLDKMIALARAARPFVSTIESFDNQVRLGGPGWLERAFGFVQTDEHVRSACESFRSALADVVHDIINKPK